MCLMAGDIKGGKTVVCFDDEYDVSQLWLYRVSSSNAYRECKD